MGSDKMFMKDEHSYDDEYPKHKVILTNDFFISKYPVTQELWESIMGIELRYRYKKYWGLRKPIVNISWIEAARFCNLLSIKLNCVPVYIFENPALDDTVVSLNKTANGYRLPTEAEWEYCCRAATATKYWSGDEYKELLKNEWTGDNTSKLRSVGKKRENPWGLMDMNGLIGEWCNDWYSKDYYSNSTLENPMGPDNGNTRVWRGGTYKWGKISGHSMPNYYRSADRDQDIQTNYSEFVGFRIMKGNYEKT
jgi:formylglycine-generating enzyme required for sulfatase activity